MFVLYLQPLTMSPNCVIPLIPHYGGDTVLERKTTVFSPVPAQGLKPPFYFLKKTFVSTKV